MNSFRCIENISLLIGLFFSLNTNAQNWIQNGSDIDGAASGDESGYAVSLSGNGNILAIGALNNADSGVLSGHVRIYDWSASSSSWVQQGSDINGEASGDYSGSSVSINNNGSIVAIGSPYHKVNGNSAGHVRVFEFSGSWGRTKKGQNLSAENADDQFGYSVSISSNGEVLAIGAPGNDGNGSDAGHVRVFDWTGSSWIQRGSDIDGDSIGDRSGTSIQLSADGNIIAIGAPYNDGANGVNSGHVRIYNWTGTAWTQMGNDLDGEDWGDYSGTSIALSSDGNIVAIGAPNNLGANGQAGHVRVYYWDTAVWSQIGNDIDGESASDEFGGSVSLNNDGSVLAVGAILNGGNGTISGHVRTFYWDASIWSQQGIDIDGEKEYDKSGFSVSLNSKGNKLAIGAPQNGGTGSFAGHVRVYSYGTAVGIKENSLTQMSVFPNPTSGILLIDFTEDYGNVRINIQDITGRIISSQTSPSNNRTQIEIEGESGIYFVELSSEKGFSQVVKVIKQ